MRTQPTMRRATSARFLFLGGASSGGESSVGLHEPRNQPPSAGVVPESGDELPGAEPVRVDPLSVVGLLAPEGDEVELDMGRRKVRLGIGVIRLLLLYVTARTPLLDGTLLAHDPVP
jgi:hypothetical protein